MLRDMSTIEEHSIKVFARRCINHREYTPNRFIKHREHSKRYIKNREWSNENKFTTILISSILDTYRLYHFCELWVYSILMNLVEAKKIKHIHWFIYLYIVISYIMCKCVLYVYICLCFITYNRFEEYE